MPHWTTIPIVRDAFFDRGGGGVMDWEFERPMRILDQNFGMGMTEDDIIPSSYAPYYSRGRR